MRRLGVLAVVGIITACSGGGGGGGGVTGGAAYSCNIASVNVCMQMTGTIASANVSTFQTDCTTPQGSGGLGGTYATAACSTANAIGKCTVPSTVSGETDAVIFYSGLWTVSLAQSACTTPVASGGFGGTWTAL